MNSSIYRFTLGLNISQSQVSIPVMLGDTGREWRIILSDGGKPYIIEDGCLAKLTIKRPSGTRLEAFCTVLDNTTIVYKFIENPQTCIVEGVHNCDITLYGLYEEILATARFTMVVSERVNPRDDEVLTDDDRTAIDAMIHAEVLRHAFEAERKSAEEQRATAETERATAETERATAETERVQKDTQREVVLNEVKATADDAKTIANNAKNTADSAHQNAMEAKSTSQLAYWSADQALKTANEAKSYTDESIASLIGSAPKDLDTLEELADWIKSDETGTAAMAKSIAEAKQNADVLSRTTIREILPNENGVFPIREEGTYNIHIEWTESSEEEDKDVYNMVEVFLVNENGQNITPSIFAKDDINAKYYDGEFYVTVAIEEQGVAGIIVDAHAPRTKSVAITTTNSFSSSTNRKFSKIKDALGSYITDIDTLLGGE